jgi:hypothetical protein
VAKTAESDKVIGELRSIQNELKALEETLQNLTEVLFPEKHKIRNSPRNRKDEKQELPTRKQKSCLKQQQRIVLKKDERKSNHLIQSGKIVS